MGASQTSTYKLTEDEELQPPAAKRARLEPQPYTEAYENINNSTTSVATATSRKFQFSFIQILDRSMHRVYVCEELVEPYTCR
ncbi:hypothetical protein ElyMa_000761000 [Elysia marginata]|uniref:Uncharacterized protein n=1 Tax=Elysia marginata TaxID=1093978 RepID=A0AAV4GRQ8_9GAST|nr:hypothetical protein ElyMa_000761000 [Elysia marginata]